MTVLVLCFLIGTMAGLRSMSAPAAVSWAAYLGWLPLSESWLAFLGYSWTPWILSFLAAGELVTDQLPSTPSRKVPVQFGGRLLTGAVSGAALGLAAGSPWLGALAGMVGAAAGTLGGAAARAKLAAVFGRDLPAALIEDAVAIIGSLLIVLAAA
jgi:uncharacterized membrane protein